MRVKTGIKRLWKRRFFFTAMTVMITIMRKIKKRMNLGNTVWEGMILTIRGKGKEFGPEDGEYAD